ncbi:SMP-30/gluconolactonase/LRE family protein [Streptomyces fulvoviolaceus]|uniref:SMP-30/gluconolactonase/LRE family protein n=1 Tax=Streptomyces fulvoviolaceus TaxID=285535 RepID=UPI000A9639C9|nr:superoxide dismutase [Streptomyces fulvoviolaceus]MCT9078988.1 superoxide dismutase [Streptomyces fulvoviolaceus]
MSRPIHRRTFLTSATAVAVAAAVPTARAADAPGVGTAFTLPGERAYPEGIGLDPRTGDAYVGSFTTGAVYRATPGAGAAEVFLPAGTDGRGTTAGLKADRAGRLWVVGPSAGVDVYDLRTRALLARFEVPGDAARFVNDLAIAPDGTAYVTDSARGVLYRVTPGDLARALGGSATLTVYRDLRAALASDPPVTRVFNGIVATSRFLLVVDTATGDLVRVDLASGAVCQVSLHGGDLAHGDGLELVRGTLWAAHNTTNTISRWRLSADGCAARLERSVTDTALQIPTALAHSHGRLLVVRSQFDKGGPFGPGVPETPFSVARVAGI